MTDLKRPSKIKGVWSSFQDPEPEQTERITYTVSDKHIPYQDFCKEYKLDFNTLFNTSITESLLIKKGKYAPLFGIKGTGNTAMYTGSSVLSLGVAMGKGFIFYPNMYSPYLNSDWFVEGYACDPLASMGGMQCQILASDLFPLVTEELELQRVYAEININTKRREEERIKKLEDYNNDLVKFRKRDYAEYLSSIKDMKFSHNFVERGTWISAKQQFMVYEKFKGVECCALFKEGNETDDYMVYIPVDWLNNIGYDESFVKSYVDFINKMNLSKTVLYLGIGQYKEHKKQLKQLDRETGYSLMNDAYHKIVIPSTESPYLTYIMFILVRYLYYYGYNNIPYIAMRMKEEYGELASEWQCLLMAHAVSKFSGAYGLVESYGRNNVLILVRALSSENSEDKVLESVYEKGAVNSSFLTSHYVNPDINSYFINENFDAIYNIFNNLKS